MTANKFQFIDQKHYPTYEVQNFKTFLIGYWTFSRYHQKVSTSNNQLEGSLDKIYVINVYLQIGENNERQLLKKN